MNDMIVSRRNPMNHRGGLALIRGTWLSWMQARSFFFLLAFGWMIPPLVTLFVWSAAADESEVAGFSRAGFAAYYLALILVNQFTYSTTNWTVGDVIREGKLSPQLLYPLSPLYHAVASEIAGKVVFMAFVVPMTALLALIFRPELTITLSGALSFVPALFLAWMLRFFWGYWLALLAFWATRADALLVVQDTLVFLLGGLVAPVALLPGALRTVAHILPFRYMVAFPVEVLTGQLSGTDMLTGFAVQTLWLIVAVAFYRLIWVNGVKRYSAIGG